MENLRISDAIAVKLRDKHGVERREVENCFANREGRLLLDTRARHRTHPPTLWFIAKTNSGRLLKIVYIQEGRMVTVKSAFEPNEVELRLYARFGGVSY
ncbi:MAG: ADP-ribosyl-(dinitrogen reductase) hydrolase [Burkholderiales bacterium]|nr:ADP-ribosyl-(dinitrogen reductase) hydrolase [Burkholderiales bacterium]